MISPIRIYNAALLKNISDAVYKSFGYPVSVSNLIDDISFAYYPGRTQYNSTAIIEKISELTPPGVIKVIAVTRVDLFIPIFTYVYGEAQLAGRACIVSSHRLEDSPGISFESKNARQRIAKEAVHELGHTFNIRHCKDPRCIMHFSRSLEDVDRKSERMCRYCQVLLEDEKKRLAKKFPPAG
ncbi:archaemetzincin family Zn-dependent metalloprotease [Thermodesulfobacteriota bacterium]